MISSTPKSVLEPRLRSVGTAPLLPHPRLGYLFVLSIPICAGLATARGVSIAGLNYTGWMWLSTFLVGAFLLLIDRAVHNEEQIVFPYRPWLLWFSFVWISLAWVDGISRRHVQEAVQVTMPLLIGLVASVFVRTDRQVDLLLKIFRYSFVLLAISAILARNAHLDGLDLETGIRPLSMTATLIGCVFLTQLPERKLFALTGWTACVLLTFLTGARTSTALMIFLLAVNPMVKGIRTRVLLGLVMAAVGIGIFYTPQFQARFFASGTGSLADIFHGEMSGTGRFDVWPLILERAWQHPVLGEGIGTAYDFVPTVWEDVNQCHNDYLRTFFEFGLVGLSLFVFVLGWQTLRLWHETHRSMGATQRAFAAAFLGMLAFVISACTDNPLGYNIWFTNPLFALMGAAYGAAENGPQLRAEDSQEFA